MTTVMMRRAGWSRGTTTSLAPTCARRFARRRSRGSCRSLAPSLFVEIGSPSTRKRDKTIKRRLYERFGVEEYWVIDPKRETIKVFRRQGSFYALAAELVLDRGEVLSTPLLPHLELPLMKIFEDQ